jgi:arabinofuranosyltransferase
MSHETNRIVSAIGIFVFVLFGLHFVNYAPDDIWISLRYADNLADGQGLTYNPGERIEGYSNFLWVLVLSLFGPLTDKYMLTLVAKFLGLTCGVLAVWLLARTAKSAPFGGGAKKYWGLAPFALGLYGYPAFWSSTGMETGFYLLLVVAALGAHLTWIKKGGYIWAMLAAAAFIATALTRPEGILFFAAALFAEFLSRLRHKKLPDGSTWLWMMAVLAAYAAFFLWRHSYFGQWWPNTFYAKAGGGYAKYVEGARYLLLNLAALGWSNPILLVLLAVPFAMHRKVDRARGFLGLCIAGQLAFVLFAGGDWMGGARFLVPAMPVAALLIPETVYRMQMRFSSSTATFATGWGALVLAVILVGNFGVHLYNAKQVRHDVSGFRAYDGARFFKPDHFMIADYLRADAKPDDLVALGEAGLIPYLTDLPALDLFGLMDPHLARLPGLRHQKIDNDYVFGRDPAYVVLGGCKVWSDGMTSDFAYARELLRDSRLIERYDRSFMHHTFLVFKRKSE